MAYQSSSVSIKDLKQYEGWLNVWEVESENSKTLFDDGRVPLPIYEPHFCVLQQDEQSLTHHRTEQTKDEKKRPNNLPCVRLDGGKLNFDRRWGYGTLRDVHSLFPSPLASLDLFNKSQTLDARIVSPQDGSTEKGLGERRGSDPVIAITASKSNSTTPTDENMEAATPSTKFSNFFSRKGLRGTLLRTKSTSKLDKRKSNPGNDESKKSVLKRSMSLGRLSRKKDKAKTPDTELGHAWTPISAKMRTARSHESLLCSPTSMHSIDLSAPDVEIKPLHSSILGQDHCFQVSTSNGSKYYSCRSAEERQKWIECLRKTADPTQDQSHRTENSLKLWILEAKNLAPKKRYFCELFLDKTKYARTSTKQKGDLLFWGEHFEFSNLPAVDVVTVNIYREADKKKKKEKHALLGYINIPVGVISGRQLVERWYTASSGVVGKMGKENKTELPLIRLKAQYQTVNILPMDMYQPFINYLSTQSQELVEVLEPVLSIKAKEEIARVLVHSLQKMGKAPEFLSDIIMSEVAKSDNENITFRGNSIATKAMESYMKLVGEKYIQETLGEFIHSVLEMTEDCEVDPLRVPNNTALQKNQANLVKLCREALKTITNSYSHFPVELRKVFCSLKQQCVEKQKAELADNLISACIFLRFLCPAILSPSLFSLIQEFPEEKAARNLTLIAKTVQTLANFTKFGAKEGFMTFLNDFVDSEVTQVRTFLRRISSNERSSNAQSQFDGYVDLGKELSHLAIILTEAVDKVSEDDQQKLTGVRTVLCDINQSFQTPPSQRRPATPQLLQNGLFDMQVHTCEDIENANFSASQSVCTLTSSQTMPSVTVTSSLSVPSMNVTSSLSGQVVTSTPASQTLPCRLYRDAALSLATDFGVAAVGDTSTFSSLNETVQGSYSYTLGGNSRRPASTLSTTDDYVMFTAFNERVNAHGVDHQISSTGANAQDINQSWNRMVQIAESSNNGDYIDLSTMPFIDDVQDDIQNSSVELDNHLDSGSIGHVSTVASSGYQSFGYSQSSSPVDSTIQHDSAVAEKNQSPITVTKPLSFANPLFKHSNKQTTNIRSTAVKTPPLTRVSSGSSLSGDDYTTEIQQSTLEDHGSKVNKEKVKKTVHQLTAARKLQNAQCSSSSNESLGDSSSRLNPSRRRRPKCPPQAQLSHSPSVQRKQNTTQSQESSSVDSSLPRETVSSSNELTRSADFAQLKRKFSQQERNSHPAVNQASGMSETSGYATVNPNTWRLSIPQNTVRMGIRSVQRRIQEQEKTKTDYEHELTLLQQQLAETQAMLAEAQQRLETQQSDSAEMSTDWQTKLKESEKHMMQQQAEKDEQMKHIIHRLMNVEEELRREQVELQSVVQQKQKVIEAQERKIQSMDSANMRLLTALNQLKERYQLHSRNGVSPQNKDTINSYSEAKGGHS